jgi:hypothetical protein
MVPKQQTSSFWFQGTLGLKEFATKMETFVLELQMQTQINLG